MPGIGIATGWIALVAGFAAPTGWHHASAHVFAMPDSAVAGRAAVLSFGVPEGCTGSPTQSLEIAIPASIRIVKPQPKTGWEIEMAHESLEDPMMSEGVVHKERVTSIKWVGGPLPDSQFEQFVIVVKLPPDAGKLYFPAVQTCANKEIRWVDVPDGSHPQGIRHAAPAITLLASAAG